MDRITTKDELFNALDELVQAIDNPLGGDLEINIYWCLESGSPIGRRRDGRRGSRSTSLSRLQSAPR